MNEYQLIRVSNLTTTALRILMTISFRFKCVKKVNNFRTVLSFIPRHATSVRQISFLLPQMSEPTENCVSFFFLDRNFVLFVTKKYLSTVQCMMSLVILDQPHPPQPRFLPAFNPCTGKSSLVCKNCCPSL